MPRFHTTLILLLLSCLAGCETKHDPLNASFDNLAKEVRVEVIQTPADNPDEASAYLDGKSHPHQVRVILKNGDEFTHYFQPNGLLRKSEVFVAKTGEMVSVRDN